MDKTIKIFIFLFTLIFISGCSEQINMEDLVERGAEGERLVYKINSDFPFSGQALEYYEEPKTEIRTDTDDEEIFLAAVIKSKINFMNGLAHGTSLYYHRNGQIRKISYMENGLANGKSELFTDQGVLLHRELYKDGLLDGISELYDQGLVVGRVNYKAGVEDGLTEYFYSTGQLEYRLIYKNGTPVGVPEHFTKEGKLIPKEMKEMSNLVNFETTLGPIVIELFEEDAPITTKNFLDYADSGFYDGTLFHRVIPGFVIQGGGLEPGMQDKAGNPPIQNEANNGQKNLKWSLSMARTSDPHSATSQFFINLENNPSLDHTSETPQGWGYAVFGTVIDGFETVEAIASVSTGSSGHHQDVPLEDITVQKTKVTKE